MIQEGAVVQAAQGDQISFTRPVHVPGLELCRARYERRAFPAHVHEEYVVGAMTLGAESLSIRGATHVAGKGDLILIEPGERHSNCTAMAGAFAYVVMYIPAELMTQGLCDLVDTHKVRPPHFRVPTPRLAALHRTLVRTHALLSSSPGALEQQTAFLMFLSQLLESQQLCFASIRSKPEHRKISIAQSYIDAHFQESISLREVAAIAGLSQFHLLRSFKSQVGLPPAAYQTHLRIAEAKRRLRSGSDVAETAAELGFVDQSHLTRHFQRIVGTSPGRYRAAITSNTLDI